MTTAAPIFFLCCVPMFWPSSLLIHFSHLPCTVSLSPTSSHIHTCTPQTRTHAHACIISITMATLSKAPLLPERALPFEPSFVLLQRRGRERRRADVRRCVCVCVFQGCTRVCLYCVSCDCMCVSMAGPQGSDTGMLDRMLEEKSRKSRINSKHTLSDGFVETQQTVSSIPWV